MQIVKSEPFTMAVALEFQRKEINKYKKVITAEVFDKLCKHAEQKNVGVTNPYEIFRGQDVHIWISNYASQFVEE